MIIVPGPASQSLGKKIAEKLIINNSDLSNPSTKSLLSYVRS